VEITLGGDTGNQKWRYVQAFFFLLLSAGTAFGQLRQYTHQKGPAFAIVEIESAGGCHNLGNALIHHFI
jgi:hypothetical protein